MNMDSHGGMILKGKH